MCASVNISAYRKSTIKYQITHNVSYVVVVICVKHIRTPTNTEVERLTPLTKRQ